MDDLRTERTFGVTANLKQRQRQQLLALANSEAYPALLDCLEMVCIEIETKLINTEPADEQAVLANHRMAKAAWQMFTHLQEKIQTEGQLYVQSVAKPTPIPELTPREQWVESTLNPMIPDPEDLWSH